MPELTGSPEKEVGNVPNETGLGKVCSTQQRADSYWASVDNGNGKKGNATHKLRRKKYQPRNKPNGTVTKKIKGKE